MLRSRVVSDSVYCAEIMPYLVLVDKRTVRLSSIPYLPNAGAAVVQVVHHLSFSYVAIYTRP